MREPDERAEHHFEAAPKAPATERTKAAEESRAVESRAVEEARAVDGGASRRPTGTAKAWLRPTSRLDWLAVVPVALVLFGLWDWLLPPTSGPLALLTIVEPHLFIVGLVVLAPIALLARARFLALALLVTLLAGGGFFGSEWISLPGAGASDPNLSVMSWNVQFGARTPAEQVAQLHGVDVDVVGLMELEPDAAAAIVSDETLTARFPYRKIAARPLAGGLALLSRYPMRLVASSWPPALLEVTLDTPEGPVHMIEAHPEHADITTVTPLDLPIDYEPAGRDRSIGLIRQSIDRAMAAGDRLVVLGDFNTSPYEAEYRIITRGLRDTHAEVGQGPGWTWRPSRLTFLQLAFVRIDVQLTAGAIRPSSTHVDCSLPGDHCRLFGTYRVE